MPLDPKGSGQGVAYKTKRTRTDVGTKRHDEYKALVLLFFLYSSCSVSPLHWEKSVPMVIPASLTMMPKPSLKIGSLISGPCVLSGRAMVIAPKD